MATLNETSIKRVSQNIQQLIQTTIEHTKVLEKNTLKLRMKIKADLNSLTKGLSQRDQSALKKVIANSVQENMNTLSSTAKVAGADGPCLGEGSHGLQYEDGGLYGGVCAIGSIHGLTGGGVFGGFHY